MAATNVIRTSNPERDYSLPGNFVGTGAPANGDAIATDLKKYPQYSTYIDTATDIMYYRKAKAGVAADWVDIKPAP